MSHHLLTSSLHKKLVELDKSNMENDVQASERRLFLEACVGVCDSQVQNKVLSLSCKVPSKSDKKKIFERDLNLKFCTTFNVPSWKSVTRALPDAPDLILDVPALKDDFCRFIFCLIYFLGKN